MKYFGIAIVFLAMAYFSACKQQEGLKDPERELKWYKGNLHTHSYWSDGDEFPEVIMDWYKSNGYQFVALSDHNILADSTKWKEIRNEKIYQDGFQNYLNNYGADWVNYKEDSGLIHVKLKTLEEYRGLFEEDEKFLIIQSEEITDGFENKEVHVNATNIQSLILPQGGNSVSEVLQNNIDAVLDQRKKTGEPMIPHVNHPNFRYSVTLADMISLKGERFFEVYNGHNDVHNLGDSIHISTETMWDLINIAYIQEGKPLIYGLATDDSHNYHVFGSEWSNAGRGWIMVRADTLRPDALILAMESGEFYSSTGVELQRLEFDGYKLVIEVMPETGVEYSISFIGCRKDGSVPEIFDTIEGSNATFELSDDILFVRSKITSSKLHDNPIEDLIYEMAWTQPVIK